MEASGKVNASVVIVGATIVTGSSTLAGKSNTRAGAVFPGSTLGVVTTRLRVFRGVDADDAK